MRDPRRALIITLSIAMVTALSCGKTKGKEPDIKEEQNPKDTTSATRPPEPATLKDVSFFEDHQKTTSMSVTLTDGNPDASGASAALARPEARELSKSRSDALLSRMKDLVQQDGDQVDFAKREKSLPPPRTGDTIEGTFPPESSYARPEVVAADTTSPLEVLRHAPEGDVPIAPHVSITFNHPMVAVTSHKDSVAAGVPVEISPEVEGDWRWVGAKTLLFEAPEATRLPMATEYTVKIPASTKSKNGNAIAKEKSWTFKTPAPTLVSRYPQYGTLPRDQKMFISFDQKIDEKEILEHIRIKAGRIFGARQPMMLTSEEIESDPKIKSMVANAKPGTWVAFKADELLPYDSTVNITVEKGAPSAEGPLTTTSDQNFSFSTYGPLIIRKGQCSWNSNCRPNDSFFFEFSNALDAEKYDASKIKVEPSFPGMSTYVSGNYLYINGNKPGRRTYKVTISKDVEDVFEQTLGKERTFEFEVGVANPSLTATGGSLVVLDPSSAPSYSVFSVNYSKLRVKTYEVTPSQWHDYQKYYRDYNYYGKHKLTPPGKLLANEVIKVGGEPDDIVETKIPLDKALGGDALGNVVILVEPEAVVDGAEMPKYKPLIRSWVQSTRIGLDAFVDGEELIGWATALGSGEPMSGVKLTIGGGVSLSTGKDGVAKMELPASGDSTHAYMLAEKGKDIAFLPEQIWGNSSSWYKRPGYDRLKWFVFDDRKMYRPDEEVHLKGWVRVHEAKEGGDIRLPDLDGKKLIYSVRGPQGNTITEGESTVRGLGGFDFSFQLPKTPNLGNAYVDIRIPGATMSSSSYTHAFQIQEFRRPEFEVSANAPQGPFIEGEDATISVEAKYYSGGALPNAETSWHVTTSTASFTPPNQSKYTFGSWTPWWVTWNSPTSNTSTSESFQGKTDVTGNHHLELAFGDIDPPRPVSVNASASVTDVNRQAWNASTRLLVHPSQHYVGMRSDRYFVEKGKPLEIKVIVSDIDGNQLASRPVKVRAARTTWNWSNGKYKEEFADPQDCELSTEAKKESTCTFKTDIGGSYKITATTVDDYGRENFTQITRWVSGGERPAARKVEQERVQMIPDKELYQPGDTAKILVQTPFTPAEALLTLRRDGITEERRFTMSESTTTLEIPIKERHLPNLHVQVDLVGSSPRLNEKGEKDESLPRRPAYAMGNLNLKIPPTQRELAVEVSPKSAALSPGEETSVEVQVKDAAGKPVADAEVAIVIVDESILALSSYAMADPMTLFYSGRGAGGRDHHSRANILLVDPGKLRAEVAPGGLKATGRGSDRGGGGMRERSLKRSKKSKDRKPSPAPAAMAPMEEASVDAPSDDGFLAFDAEGGEATGGDAGGGVIATRSDFNPLANFSPSVQTDASGKAMIDIKLPDNLTRYRVMAVAVEGGKKYGKGESAITARLPLMVRPSAPRFLNFGDKFELPVVLQNQTDEAMTVELATRATNIEMIKSSGYQVTVPANDRVEVRFPATTALAGTARFQVAASTKSFSDGTEFELPVWTPATSEAFATYGVLDKGSVAQPIKMPGEVWPQFGGLEVTTSSTAMQALTDAFIYLYHYEYQCAEQISSRMITVAALRDVLSAFEAEGMPSAAEVKRSMTRDIDELVGRQNYDGGFGLWRKGQPSWPYVSLHASHALARAQSKGYEVPARAVSQSQAYLKNIERHIPHYYSEWTRRTIIAYALYVRGLLGDKDPAGARALIARAGNLDELSFETLGWLLGVMTGDASSASEIAQIRRYLGNRVTETAGAAHYARSFSDGAYLIMHSDRRADGIILEALIKDSPKSDLIPKIVKGLMAHRKKGRWGNTQENAFVLLALDLYFNTYEKQTPDFVARAWLGDTYAGEHKFKGRTTEEHKIAIPMSYVASADGEQNLYLQKDGKGRMYYRVGMTYAPKDLFIEQADHGFVVERVYEPVEDDGDVSREADGTWVIKAGAKVRVKLTMVAPTRRYHVALVDPLPAGLETLNPALAVTGDIPQDQAENTGRGGRGGWWWWSRPWYEHQNMRDERTEAFTTLLWGGVHSYSYYARATTPGEFIVPPAKAEEMYSPETFGRSASDRVKVVDR